uniref:SPIN-DOC-like zinc-finger domain-containing protein n=1 Tax=Eptatretus burgeri TaxID=7764 RepID=A0A8C4NE98_EPTBU
MWTCKRKLLDKNRSFKKEWEAFFFVERKGKALCIICHETVAIMKVCNMKRHFTSVHPKQAALPDDKKKAEFGRLSAQLEKQSAFMKRSVSSTQAAAQSNTRASCRVAHLVATNLKPFTEGEFLKDLIRRIEEMAADVRGTLKDMCQSARFFSIALDESTDIKDTAQLAIFFRGGRDDFVIFEEFIRLIPLSGTTTGADVCKAVTAWLKEVDLNLSRMCGITTDGAPAMIGDKKGFAALLVKYLRSLGHQQDVKRFHCLVHQEALCAKSVTITEVLTVVVRAVNFVCTRALNHRQFRDLLADAEAEFGDLIYFCEVHWLSQGKMLERVFSLRDELASFLWEKGNPVLQFEDPAWVCDLGFLLFSAPFDVDSVDVPDDLQLELFELQCSESHRAKFAFECKLRLWEHQLNQNKFTHFTRLAELRPTPTACRRYAAALSELRGEFDVRTCEKEFKLFSAPFDVDSVDVPDDLQLELFELQCSESHRAKFALLSPMKFWPSLSASRAFPVLVREALRLASLFGSTYSCEQLFSHMKLTKNKTRAQFTDAHLQDVLLLASSSIKPDIDSVCIKESPAFTLIVSHCDYCKS